MHVPTTDVVRWRYWAYGSPIPEWLQATAEHVAGPEFDTWLMGVKARARHEGFEAGYDEGYSDGLAKIGVKEEA